LLWFLIAVDDESFEITYAAHTAVCTFLLDASGICRAIVMHPTMNRRTSRGAARCIGAQYVASLDPKAEGGIIEAPKTGTAMLFAKVDENGRISLVRTGRITRFETREGWTDESGATPTHTTFAAPTKRAPHGGSDPYADPTDRTVQVRAIPLESGVELSPSAANDDDEATRLHHKAASGDTPRNASRLRRSRR
jgi:hypothetical protein